MAGAAGGGGTGGKERRSEVAEVEDEVVFIPGPFAGLARFKQPIHQTLAWHLAAPGEMGLDVMAGCSGFRSKRLALSGRQIKPALFEIKFIFFAHSLLISACLFMGKLLPFW